MLFIHFLCINSFFFKINGSVEWASAHCDAFMMRTEIEIYKDIVYAQSNVQVNIWRSSVYIFIWEQWR